MQVSIFRLRTRDVLTLCVISLLLLGVIMVQSASTTAQTDWQWTGPGLKNAIFAAFGILAFFAAGAFNYGRLAKKSARWYQNPVLWFLAFSVLVNLLVLLPQIGVSVNGARRWIRLGPIQLQPSELAKWAVVLYLSWWLTHRPLNLDNFFTGFIPTLIPVAALCLLVVIQDFGTATLIALAALTLLLAGNIRLRHLLIAIPPVLAIGLWFIMHKEYRWRRVTAFMHPYDSAQKEGYHMIQSLLSFATGGWTGRGLGNGIQKLGYLPEDTTDFIFAVICEELGIFGAMLTVCLYLGVLYCAWQTIKAKHDNFGRMLAFGIGAMVALQALINIAVATVSVPTKGLSLPLISAGGSGLVITCIALGLMRSVCRFRQPADSLNEPATNEKRRRPSVPPGSIEPPAHRITPALLQQFTTG
jgi:cell division protein FtsW